MTVRKWEHTTDDKKPWRVTVRQGARIDVHSFARESEADAFVASGPSIAPMALR